MLSYISEDMQTWQYLGEQWHGNRVWGPRVECPYQTQVGINNITILKISAPGKGNDYFFVGMIDGNGSTFQPSAATAGGVQQDWGGSYAGAIMQAPDDRSLLWTWVQAGAYNLGKLSPPASFDCALSLPRVLGVASDGQPTWEVAREMDTLRLIGTASVWGPITLAANASMLLAVPLNASGDAMEFRLNFTVADPSMCFAIDVRATADGSEYTTVAYSEMSGLSVHSLSRDPLAGINSAAAPAAANGAVRTGAAHELRIFVDKSVIEVLLDGRLSVTTRAYPLSAEAVIARLGNPTASPWGQCGRGPVTFTSVESWGMGTIW